jgi:phosphatidylserine/phosphatidylglycerophosphate/cardiolipin synthase-like enzyme
VDDAELVGGVLVDAPDPQSAARILYDLLTGDATDRAAARAAGMDPDLVAVIANRLGKDRARVQEACSLAAAWVAGRRSVVVGEPWELVASLPSATSLPAGLRHTTAETLVQLVTQSSRTLRIVAPFIDWLGLSFLADSLSAATARGVSLRVLLPTRSTHAADALDELEQTIRREGDIAKYSLSTLRNDAPWAHLKVVSSDSAAAYIGSANVTGAAITGPNLELGVLVRGPAVAVVEQLVDSFRQ